MKNELLVCMAVIALLSSCNGANPGADGSKVPAIDLANLDTTYTPGQNFYMYATGGWQKNNPLKAEYSRFGTFDQLGENNQKRLNDLFQGLAAKKNKKGTEAQKIADLYTMGLDSVRLNAEGLKPVMAVLEEIEGVVDSRSFAVISAKMGEKGIGSVCGIGVGADMMDSNMNVLNVDASGLELRNRDYYLLPGNQALRDGYKQYLERIFALAGYEDAAARAADAFGFQMKLAVPTWSMIQQRDIQAQYNPMSSEELNAKYPNFYFNDIFEVLGIPAQEKLILGQPSYFEAVNELLAQTPAEVLRHYLQASCLSSACGYVSDDLYAAHFDFFSTQLSGIKEQKPRWKRAMSMPNFVLGEAVGKLYVEKYFSAKDKKRMQEMVANLQESLGEHIDALDWMSDSTKARAHEKLAAFTVKIGYPDKWKDYSELEIDPTLSYYENYLRVCKWYNDDNLKDLGQPVDRDRWFMSPQTVNAYYNPTTNEICFPAGILQPPFYNSNADDAVNYGAIGVVISHEMTHGFDDQGRLFDKDGNMNNWWTDADAEAFATKTQVLVDQFNKVEVLPGVYANGAASLGENIADQGGLRIAYTAMEKVAGGQAPIDGFTPQQRFYLGYATVWGQNITDEEIRKRVLTDVHSIGRDRVNATLRNIETFYQAFGIAESDPMYMPEDQRVIIW